MKTKLWSIPYLLFVFIYTLMCSGFGGRALWCDEILCVFSQRMSVAQLLAYEHLRRYDGLPPLGYILMRPFQFVFGLENGAHIFTALCTVIIAGAVLHTLCYIIGKRPHPVLGLLVITNPFLIWHGSEFRLYSLLAAFGALIMYQLVVHGKSMNLKARVYLGFLGICFINSIYSGIFIWSVLAGAILIYAWKSEGFKKALHLSPVFALPVLISLPFYIMAMRVQQHLGTKSGISKDALINLFPGIADYMVTIFPSLTAGWWLGVTVLTFGIFYLIVRRQMKYEALILCVLIAGIIPFLCFSMLRQYLVPASRYWFYASSPTLVLVTLGIHSLLTGPRYSGVFRLLGYSLSIILIAGNVIAISAVACLDGRLTPYKKLQAYIRSLPPNRTVVSINYYENRFLGGYYPIPNNGFLLSPAAWEEGTDARVRGAKKIIKLIPDVVTYISGKEIYDEYKKTGYATTNGFVYQFPSVLELAHLLHVFPEPSYKPYPYALYHETCATLSSRAEKDGVSITLPISGFNAVSFRNQQGELFFGLVSPSQMQFDIYVPAGMAAQPVELLMDCVSYRSSGLQVLIDGTPSLSAPQLNITDAMGYYIPQKKQFKGLPDPAYLAQDGMSFVLAFHPQQVAIPLGLLTPGWHSVTLATKQKSPWMILSHMISAGSLKTQ